MAKYTAVEMRSAASYVETYDVFEDHDREIASMLRQAADMMERERKYEYAIKYKKGWSACVERMSKTHYESDALALADACPLVTEETKLVRRAVGEWEEVK